jgi:signal transduction histidine kinase
MDIVGLVAGKAVGRSIAMLAAGFMAFATLSFRVFAEQWKVSELMVEGVFVQLHDIGIPAFMIGMAGRTAGVTRVRVQPMESGTAAYIGRDIFMTIQTQGSLFGAFELCVAGIAVLFVLRVTFDNLAGHDERFDLGIGLFGCHEKECHRGSGQ